MAEILNIEKQVPRMVGAKEVAAFLGVSLVWLRNNADQIPGFLRVSAAGRQDMYRWDFNKVLAWQEEQERARRQQSA